MENQGYTIYWYEEDEEREEYRETAYQAIVLAADISFEKKTTVWIKDLAEDADLPVGAYGGVVYSDYCPADELIEEEEE